jgi:hypothetical protein
MHISDRLITGDSESNPREFDGLRKRITGAALFTGTGAGTNGPLSLEVLDAAIDSSMRRTPSSPRRRCAAS